MNIISHLNDKIKRIDVLDELRSKEDREQFYFEISQKYVKEIIINFISARVLYGESIIKLNEIIRTNDEVKYKIIVTHSYLYTSLLKLNVKNVYYENQRIFKLNDEFNEKEHFLGEIEYYELLKKINDTYGFDFNNYKIESIKRRIHSAMIKFNIKDFNKFSQLILSDADCFEELFIEMSINITEFFRDEDTFFTIRNKIIPYLNSFFHINIWCAGCSTGEEPYSLAILLSELGMLNKCQIYATDINPYVIKEAINGLYNLEKFMNFKKSYIHLGGSKNFEEYFDKKEEIYSIKKNIKDKILFFQHSLLESGIINEFQLILCRNVLIYFNPELQEKIIFQLYNSLDRNGFLVLGKSESIIFPKVEAMFNVIDQECKIYKKSF